MDSVECGNCHSPLSEASNLPASGRLPCPKCGSVARIFNLSITASINLEASAALTISQGDQMALLPSLLMQALVVVGQKVNEGKLIEAVALPWFEIIRLLRDAPEAAFQIPPERWEEIVAGSYERAGFDEVILTPRSGDYGRDVIATIRDIGSIRVIDQVKAYKPGHLVTADDVRALFGVLLLDGASKGFLTTTSDFAPRIKDDPLLSLAMPSRIELINGLQLLERLDALARKQKS